MITKATIPVIFIPVSEPKLTEQAAVWSRVGEVIPALTCNGKKRPAAHEQVSIVKPRDRRVATGAPRTGVVASDRFSRRRLCISNLTVESVAP